MKELITITQKDGQNVVSARELYDFLGVRKDFTNWCKAMFKYGFEAESDYTRIYAQKGEKSKGRPKIEYALTLDTAKEISMLQRSEKGKQARRYFIEAEKQLQSFQNDLLMYQSKELKELRETVQDIKQQINHDSGYFTIMGYARKINQVVPYQDASMLGKRAKKLCLANDLLIEKVPDRRYGYVNSYPEIVLKQVFNGYSAF